MISFYIKFIRGTIFNLYKIYFSDLSSLSTQLYYELDKVVD